MKALFAIAVLVLAHSSSQAQYSHVRDYQKTKLIASLDPGILKGKINIAEDSSLRTPIFPKTMSVTFVQPQVVTAHALPVPSIEQAIRYHRKKEKIDLSFLMSIAYSLFFDPYFTQKYTPPRP